MSDFDISVLLFMIDNNGRSELHRFLIELQQKIVLQKKHAEKTTELYRKEYSETLAVIKEKREVAESEAEKIYWQTYHEADGNEDEKHFIAMMDADVNGVKNYFNKEEVLLLVNFTEMADNFNKSSLVIVYALLENELRKLCTLLQNRFTKRLSLQDIESKDYLQSMINYLDKVIEIDMASSAPYFSKIKQVQFLRNRIMHNGGEFSLNQNAELDQLIKNSNGHLFLQHFEALDYRSLKIKKIEYVYEQYRLIIDFVHELIWRIEEKTGHEMLLERLTFIFRFLKDGSGIHLKEIKSIKNGRIIDIGIDGDKDVEIGCKFTIKAAKKETVAIINQAEGNGNLEKLINYFNQYPDTLIKDIFEVFYKPSSPIHIDVLFY